MRSLYVNLTQHFKAIITPFPELPSFLKKQQASKTLNLEWEILVYFVSDLIYLQNQDLINIASNFEKLFKNKYPQLNFEIDYFVNKGNEILQ